MDFIEAYFARKSKSAVIQVLTRVAPYYVRIPHLHNVQNIVWHSDDARIAPPRLFYAAHTNNTRNTHKYTHMDVTHARIRLIVYDRIDVNIFRRISKYTLALSQFYIKPLLG